MPPPEIPWVLSHPIILHTLSIPAIGVACFHSLNVWRAVSVLSARDASPHRVSSPRPAATETAYQKWRAQPLRAKGKTMLAFASGLAIWVLINFTIIYLVPKIKSQSIKDTIVSVVLSLCCAPSIYALIGFIKPLPMHVRYTCKSPNGPTNLLVSPMGDPKAGARQQLLRAGLSLAAAIDIAILAACGFTAHLPILVAIMTWSFVANTRSPRMSIRASIFLPLGFLVFSCVFIGAVGVIANHYAPSGDSQDEPPPNSTVNSDWVLYLGLTFSSLAPMIIPGVITAMTFRFEYSQATEEVDRSAQISGEAPVRIPSDYPSFSFPITITSLVSLFLSLALMDIALAQYAGDAVIVAVTPIPFILTVPVVSLCTALAAAQQGKLGLWWRYNECWIPQKKSGVEQVPKSHGEIEQQALLSLNNSDEPKSWAQE